MVPELVQLLLASVLVFAVGSTSSDLCNWAQFRAAVVRDQIWMDGGNLWDASGNPVGPGDLRFLNFSSPFDATTNLTALFNTKSKISTGNSNIDPNYVDGTMFANDNEICLFGGLAFLGPDMINQSNTVLGFELYNDIPTRTAWSPGEPFEDAIPKSMTGYITNGAGTNAPSENLGFYFSGMQNPNGGPIYYNIETDTMLAKTLVKVDLSTPGKGIWNRYSLPESVAPRANAQLVWVPVSTQGILVAIGGVINPEQIFEGALNETQTQQSKDQSPEFMKSIPVYDIASQIWYLQNTTAHGNYPPQLTEFCSVLAVSSDSSSFELYIYGGYDGLDSYDTPYDDVWILSMPSFAWIKAYNGIPAHGRSSHYCAQPYPNLMFVVGGEHTGDYSKCVENFVTVFNLNTLKFEEDYNPTMNKSEYEYNVPEKVYNVIGGNATGGATLLPNWSDPNLGDLFKTPYQKPIAVWYPYNTTLPPPPPGPSSSHPWLAPVIGVLAGLVILSIIAFTVMFLCRRRNIRRRNNVEYEVASLPSDYGRNRVSRWVRGMPDTAILHEIPKSEPSVTTTEIDENGALPRVYEAGGESRPVGSISPNDRNSYASVPGSSHQQRLSSARSASGDNAGTAAHEMYSPRSIAELAAPYHFQEHATYPRGMEYASDPAGPNQRAAGAATTFPNHQGSPELPSHEEIFHVQTSPSLDGSHHASPDAISPQRPSPAAELPQGHTGLSNLEHRPTHNRNVSSMSNLPSPGIGAPEAILEEQIQPLSAYEERRQPLSAYQEQRQPLSQHQYTPDYVHDLPGGLPRVQGTFGSDFGPDGQARSASVVIRKAIGSPTSPKPRPYDDWPTR